MTLSTERLKEVLKYDFATGLFRWKIRAARRIWVGDVAGAPHSEGYITIGIDGTRYFAHRLAWLYMTGKWPKNMDHVDCDKTNNRWSNLRECTSTLNKGNVPKRKDNKSGFKGVHKGASKKRPWVARIQVNRRGRYLGSFETGEQAHTAYCQAAAEHFGEFARFT